MPDSLHAVAEDLAARTKRALAADVEEMLETVVGRAGREVGERLLIHTQPELCSSPGRNMTRVLDEIFSRYRLVPRPRP